MNFLNKKYWQNRYEEKKVGWDIGYPSTPLVEYFKTLDNKKIKILIPGAGNAYEAEWLHKNGFTNVYIADWAKEPLDNFANRNNSFDGKNLLNVDFFEIEDKFDLIIEQTFFCALHPDLRIKYVHKMYEILKKEGLLIGLLFDFPLTEDGPPFGGNIESYKNLFSKKFNIEKMERCYNSIEPRKGNELFFVVKK